MTKRFRKNELTQFLPPSTELMILTHPRAKRQQTESRWRVHDGFMEAWKMSREATGILKKWNLTYGIGAMDKSNYISFRLHCHDWAPSSRPFLYLQL